MTLRERMSNKAALGRVDGFDVWVVDNKMILWSLSFV